MRTIPELKAGRTDGAVIRFLRNKELTRVLGAILFLALLPRPVEAANVTLAWNRSTSQNVAGYRIYYGVNSRTYTGVVNAGNATNATIANLVEGGTYYFAATSYNALGLESIYSGEIIYSAPTTLARLTIRRTPTSQIVLTVSSPTARTYDILATQNFTTWTVLGSVTVPAGSARDFTDTNAVNLSRRFYRARQR